MTDHPQARRHGLITEELADELVVYDVESNEAHCLNAAAAHVWRSCDGETSVDDLAAALEGETDRAVTTDVVRHALDQLAASGLLDEPSVEPSGITRRQLVRRVGVAAAVGLPLVSSILAPTAAEAATPPATTTAGTTPPVTTTAGTTPPVTTTLGPPATRRASRG